MHISTASVLRDSREYPILKYVECTLFNITYDNCITVYLYYLSIFIECEVFQRRIPLLLLYEKTNADKPMCI